MKHILKAFFALAMLAVAISATAQRDVPLGSIRNIDRNVIAGRLWVQDTSRLFAPYRVPGATDTTMLYLRNGVLYSRGVPAGGGGGTTDTTSLSNRIDHLYDSVADAKVMAQAAADYATALDTLKQNVIVLTTTGTSGAATLSNDTLNIPQYSGGGGGSSYTFSSPLSETAGAVSIANGAADGSTKGAAAYTAADFNSSSGVISLDYTNGQAATGSVKGFLTSTDWTTFNGKQAALVSGTNIKTINSTSLLGSGNISITTDTTGFGLETRAHATSTYTPLTRILTINGTTQNLSANRSWTIETLFNGGGALSGYTAVDGNSKYLSIFNVKGMDIGGDGTNPLEIFGHANVHFYETDVRFEGLPKMSGTADSALVVDYTDSYMLKMRKIGGGSGTVTSIATTSPITGGTITGTGTIGINNAAADGSTKGASTYTASDFDASSGLISIDYTNGQAADGSHKGFLTSSDWVALNAKQTALSGTGFVKISGSTISYDNSNYLTTTSASSTYQPLDADLTALAALTPTTVGSNLLTVPDPSAVRYLKINADNSVSTRTAAQMLSDIGAQASGSYLTSEVDGSVSNEGALSTTTAGGKPMLHSNTSGSTDVELEGTGGIAVSVTTGKITIDGSSISGATVDAVPTNGSTNAVQSDGVYDALALKQPLDVDLTQLAGNDGSGLAMTAGFYLKSATTIVDVYSATAPTSGQILKATSSTAATWQTPSIALGSQVTGTLPVANGGTGQTSLSAVNVGTATALANARNIGGVSFDGTANIALKAELIVAVSDETTALTTGTAKVTFRMPYAMTVTGVRASVNTVSSSGLPTFDIKESGTTILSTALTIDASEKTSVTAATAAVVSDTSLADDAEMTIDISTAGTGAKGAKIIIYGTRN